MTRRLTDTEIAVRIAPTALRWPSPDVANTVAWDRLRDCVQVLQGLARAVDGNCFAAEQDRDLSAEGIRRRRTRIGQQALAELAELKPVKAAEKAVADNLAHLEERMVEMPRPPSSIAEVMLAQEIREFVRRQKSPIDFVMRSVGDRAVLSAILNAPNFLSGLSETEWNVVRGRARETLHPEETNAQQQLRKAMGDVLEGVAATKRALMERCEMREDSEGNLHSVHEPALAKSKSAQASAA
ncbi:hypothetical protein JQ599_24730 [Bradyrhizobium diazoefficiens]|nr:hypothetical protein [Bradyrhizobium diazoefficiens]MBR0703130.1 hypothetical protein [Bradyrhizobium diazoefficiens]MBR0771886.1 hypothetical protein [Bradyrhizobium diazoefficiens]